MLYSICYDQFLSYITKLEKLVKRIWLESEVDKFGLNDYNASKTADETRNKHSETITKTRMIDVSLADIWLPTVLGVVRMAVWDNALTLI